MVDEPEIGNQEAVERLQSLSGPSDLTVTVLVAPGEYPGQRFSREADLREIFREAYERRGEETVANLQQHGIEASAKVRIGVRWIEVIREVLESEAEYVLKVSEGVVSSLPKLHSTDLNLLWKCPCPVWITRPRDRSPYKRVFAAVDPGDSRPDRDQRLDDLILQWAIDICRADGAELTVLHAWEVFGENLLLGGRGSLPPSALQQIVDETEAIHKRQVHELLSRHDLSGLGSSSQIIKGRATQVIPAAVHRGRADLLILGTIVRRGIQGFIVGSTAEEVIPNIECAILAVKPGDFVSPVQVNTQP